MASEKKKNKESEDAKRRQEYRNAKKITKKIFSCCAYHFECYRYILTGKFKKKTKPSRFNIFGVSAQKGAHCRFGFFPQEGE